MNQDLNGLWLRRRWLHEARSNEEVLELATTMAERGISRVYPFVGPPGPDGRLGWRDGDTIRPYDPATAKAFFEAFHATGSSAKVLPWSGGVAGRDIRVGDEASRSILVAEAKYIVGLGADGFHVNIEPMASYEPGYLDLLAALRADIAPAILSVAAYPPPTELHPYPDVHWTIDFLSQVCDVADEVTIMAYDTALTDDGQYSTLVSEWTRDVGLSLRERKCSWWIGVPAYDEVKPWHSPQAETLSAALRGVRSGLSVPPPANFRGVAMYASWTMDADKWATYDREWRMTGPVVAPLVDRVDATAQQPQR